MKGKHIRPASPLDLIPLSAPPAISLWLDLTQQLLFPHRPLRELLSSWLRPQEAPCTLLCFGEKGLLACVQALPHPATHAWEVRYLAVWPAAAATAHDLWRELLLKLSAEVAQGGIPRLLVSLPAEEHLPPFQNAGFVPFTEEMILLWDGADLPFVKPFPTLQPVQPENLWAIHQLYYALTPPRVQQIEGCSSDSWQPQRGEESWVWQEEDRVLVYMRRRRGPRGTILDLLLDPACRQYTPAMLAYGLLEIDPPAYVILRSYQGELVEVARRLGIGPFAEQVLLVKHLAVPSEQRQTSTARRADRKLGTAPTTPSIGNLCQRQ